MRSIWEDGEVLVPALRKLYESYKDIDLYLGGLLERPPLAGKGPPQDSPHRVRVLGSTHANLVASTFSDLKTADRFYYENGMSPPARLLPAQLAQIRKVRFAHIICNNLSPDGPNPFSKFGRR